MIVDRNQINDFADKIRESLNLSDFPVDLNLAITRLNGSVYNDLNGNEVDAYVKKNEASFSIHLNSTKPLRRQRFTLAHEIGHLFLHMGYIIDGKRWESADEFSEDIRKRTICNYSDEEYEANEFAAAFLMPKKEFTTISNKFLNLGFYEIEKIAGYFDVSIKAASNRGKWLGLFQW